MYMKCRIILILQINFLLSCKAQSLFTRLQERFFLNKITSIIYDDFESIISEELFNIRINQRGSISRNFRDRIDEKFYIYKKDQQG